MVAQFKATQLIMVLCEETERAMGGAGGDAVVVASGCRFDKGQREGGGGNGSG